MRYMGGETLLTRCRGGCPHPPSRREARNGGEDGWLVQPTFSQTAAQGGRGRPPLQLDWDGFEIYAAGRIRIVTYDMLRGGQDNTNVSHRPTEGASGTPLLTRWFLTFPTAFTPLLHKTPGGKKGKKDNRLTPQPPSAAAPLDKGSDEGLLPFYPFLLPGPCSATLPITSEKPPGTSPGG